MPISISNSFLVQLSLLGGGVKESQRLLPLLLGSAARCARLGGEHYAVLVALLQVSFEDLYRLLRYTGGVLFHVEWCIRKL